MWHKTLHLPYTRVVLRNLMVLRANHWKNLFSLETFSRLVVLWRLKTYNLSTQTTYSLVLYLSSIYPTLHNFKLLVIGVILLWKNALSYVHNIFSIYQKLMLAALTFHPVSVVGTPSSLLDARLIYLYTKSGAYIHQFGIQKSFFL